ncbi:MAG: nicotinate-nucleotide adenylyltransferase [Verrucomicrobiota bacterium]
MLKDDAAGRRRLGFLGGTFDPVHTGHLLIAQDALEQLGLTSVTFIPAAHAPLRKEAPAVSAKDRVALLKVAIAQDARFALDLSELEPGASAFTVDTVKRLRAQHPEAELFWIMGADHLDKLPDWRALEEILETVAFAVVARPGQPFTVPSGMPTEKFHLVTGHPFEVSSSELRERIAQGLPVRFFLPEAVAELIDENGFYCD